MDLDSRLVTMVTVPPFLGPAATVVVGAAVAAAVVAATVVVAEVVAAVVVVVAAAVVVLLKAAVGTAGGTVATAWVVAGTAVVGVLSPQAPSTIVKSRLNAASSGNADLRTFLIKHLLQDS